MISTKTRALLIERACISRFATDETTVKSLSDFTWRVIRAPDGESNLFLWLYGEEFVRLTNEESRQQLNASYATFWTGK